MAAAGLSLVALAINAGIPEALWSPPPAIPRAHVGDARSLAPHTHVTTSSATGSGGATSGAAAGSHGTNAAGPVSRTSGDGAGPGSLHSSSLTHGQSGG